MARKSKGIVIRVYPLAGECNTVVEVVDNRPDLPLGECKRSRFTVRFKDQYTPRKGVKSNLVAALFFADGLVALDWAMEDDYPLTVGNVGEAASG